MTEEKQTQKAESLGEYLRRLRLEKKADFEDVQQETRIPPKTLRAIEADDYATLPADAFARGFYSLYAKFLDIDQKEVLDRYDTESTAHRTGRGYSSPLREGRKVNTMAARPSMATGSFFGFSLVIIVAVVALVCWYFSWNPATFLSEKLRSFQQPVTIEGQTPDAASETSTQSSESQKAIEESKYFLTVDFLEDTTITISTDNSVPEEGIYTKGSTRSWYANETLSLILPESAKVELYFNGFQIGTPEPQNGLISITLP